VDDLTWRYINTNRLSKYERFRIGEVKVLATYFEGNERLGLALAQGH